MGRIRVHSRANMLICFVLAASCASQESQAAPVTLHDAVERYRSYLIDDVGRSLAGAQRMHQRIIADDLRGARQSWIEARAGWERSEVFTGGFVPELDQAIDAWPEAPSGFH